MLAMVTAPPPAPPFICNEAADTVPELCWMVPVPFRLRLTVPLLLFRFPFSAMPLPVRLILSAAPVLLIVPLVTLPPTFIVAILPVKERVPLFVNVPALELEF